MYTTILHATDLNETHFHICEKAVKIAKLLQAKIYLLHIVEIPTGVQLAQSLGFTELAAPSTQDAWTVMRLLGEAVGVPEDQLLVESGAINELIDKKVRELGCDLIVAGNHAPENLHSLVGSTTSHLILHAPCDVMTVRV